MGALKRLPWIDILALVPAFVLVFATGRPDDALAHLDPLVVFRIVVLLWVLVHTYFIVEHLLEDIIEMRDFLRDLERANPKLRGLERTGGLAFWWSIRRLARLTLLLGWPTYLLAAVVVALNTMTWAVLAGWRPDFLRPWLG